MAPRDWILTALLASSPVLSGGTEFRGHAVDVANAAGDGQVLRVRGSHYSIPGTAAQIVGKAQLCLSRRDSGAGIVSTDRAGGRLVAVSRVEHGAGPAPGIVKGRLAVEAGEGGFSIVLSDLGTLQDPPGDGRDEVFSPLLMRADSGWEAALDAMIGVEQALLDCMFS